MAVPPPTLLRGALAVVATPPRRLRSLRLSEDVGAAGLLVGVAPPDEELLAAAATASPSALACTGRRGTPHVIRGPRLSRPRTPVEEEVIGVVA